MTVQAGATAFMSGSHLYSLLSPSQQMLVENSRVTYAPHPFRWNAAVKGRSNGLGQFSEGREAPLEDLPPFEDEKVLTYPMLWTVRVIFV